MAVDLKVSVRREINRLKKNINEESTELALLRDRLRRCERAYELLAGGEPRIAPTRRATRKSSIVNWQSLLKGLPSPFTLDDIAKRGSVKAKSRAYLRQVVSRWSKGGQGKEDGTWNLQKDLMFLLVADLAAIGCIG